MNKLILFLTSYLIASLLISCEIKPEAEFSKLQEIPFNQVHIEDNIWSSRIQMIQDTTIPDLLKIAEKEGKIDNLRIIAGHKKDGRIRIYNSPDSDIWKIMEAASYSLVWRSNPKLEKKLDELIDLYAEVQADNGYINQMYMLSAKHPQNPDLSTSGITWKEKRYLKQKRIGSEQQFADNTEDRTLGIGQLYCAGHLFESAAVHFRATGKNNFLNIAIKMADCIYREFPTDKPFTYADHPQLGVGLVKLYEVTGDEKYLELANHYVHNGLHGRSRDIGAGESWKPIEEQRKAYGHAVRINYIYSASTDLCRYLEQPKTHEALDSLWHSIVDRRIYLHGGVGGPSKMEGLGEDWDLVPEHTYSECCANIATGQWNHRLNLLTGSAGYADITEIEAYNGGLSGISLDGQKFFYSNLLTVNKHKRKHSRSGVRKRYLFCCPSKVPGFVTGIGRWIYAQDSDGIYVNLYVGSTVNTKLDNKKVTITQKTGYPWEENILFTVQPESVQRFTISLRIPGWARTNSHLPSGLYRFADNKKIDWKVAVNGKNIVASELKDGYVQITREWNPGDKVELILPMPVRQVYSHPNVKPTKGKVALMRGPVVYCLEGIDNDFNVLEASLAQNPEFKTEYKADFLGGVVVLTGNAITSENDTVRFKAVPYYAWQNRGIDRMTAWMFRDFNLIRDENSLKTKITNIDTEG